MKYTTYTSASSSQDVNSIERINTSVNSVNYIEGETAEYKGIYDHAAIFGQTGSLIPDDGSRYKNGIYEILEDQNFMYRMRVNGTVYESDMLIQPSHYGWIYNLFSNQIDNGEYIYISSNVYSKGGSKTTSGIDSAYKFYDNLSWWGGKTIYGGSDGKDSFINYYDNKIKFPKTANTTVYIRHIDVTGEDVITNDVANSKSWISKFKKVGYGKKNNTTSVFPTYDTAYPEYKEKFLFKANELQKNDIITIYNKLYNETTRTRTDGNVEVDNTDYTGYALVGTVVGIGNNMVEATQNRKEKYDNGAIQYLPTFDVKEKHFGNYIVIDFLYKKEDPKVYIRHVDTTGIEPSNFNATTISSYAYGKAYSETGRTIKNVGFAERVNNTSLRIKDVYTDSKEYEYYELSYDDLTKNGGVRFYQKLYSNSTKQSTYGNTRDYTNYNNYSYGYNNSIKCVVAQGSTINEAISNRDNKINNNQFDSYGNSKGYINVETSNITEPYIFIDFYYKSNIPTGSPKLLVRHINVSGMSTTNYKQLDNYANTGKLGTNIFDGYNTVKYGSSYSYSLGVSQSGKVKYNNVGNYYNEIYTLSSNTTYRLYNEFYNSSDKDYEYIGYIMSYNNYAIDIAELLRDNKIDKANFNKTSTLDGGAGSGYVSVSTGNNKFIVVDMYYKEKDTAPIKFADVTGRLSFDSVLDDFASKTNSNYDIIPSSEDMYASITSANKYLLAGIRILPMNITTTQGITITVNVPYSYTYTYWADTECGDGHSASEDEVGDSCDRLIYCDCEDECDCEPEECDSRIRKVYETSTVNSTITKTFNYTLPYNYNYYKVSNMRVYKIDRMQLDDTENNTDLPLFDGGIHEIGVSQTYKNSVVGSFTRSTSSQVLKDSRSVDSISVSTASDETTKQLTETVTVATVEFPEEDDYDDQEYTDTQASNMFYNDYVKEYVESISDEITINTAPTITGASTNGEISNTTASNGAKVQFTVANDKIKIGTEDMLAKTSNARSVTTTVNLATYADTNSDNRHDTETKLETSYPDNVYKQYGFDKKITLKTSRNDFIQNSTTKLNIPMTRLNGERISKATIYYKLISDDAINFDVDDTTSSKHNWSRTSATVSGSFKDTEMNKQNGEKVETRITPGGNLPEEISYPYTSKKASTADGTGDVVNVFTPVKFSVSLNNGQTTTNQTIVDHTTGNELVSSYAERIQKDTRFTITIKPENSHSFYGALDNGINKYIKCYYIKFEDLDVQEIHINNTLYNGGNPVPAGMWIGPITNLGAGTTISAITRDNPNDAISVLEQESNQYIVRGVTMNATDSMLKDLLRGDYAPSLVSPSSVYKVAQNSRQYGSFNSSNTLYHTSYYIKKKLYNDNDYVAETTSVETKNLSRLYDFKVTDVKDLDWKDTFRKSTTTNTNVHSGIAYYSGVNKWDIYTTAFNKLIRRTTNEIGATSQRTLPVGPYKNTNTSYVYAPKLGYRFSFDFKTTGQITSLGKTAKIKVSFMFIDKSPGVADKDRLIENVDLYYKNSSNNYVQIGSSNDKTTLYFVPDDGYRLTYTEATYDFDTDTLTNNTVKLGSLMELNLNSKMRAVSDNSFNQIWYGEYKLPNSTIIVEDGETDLNKKLTNGYIAVKFDIEVTDKYSDGTSITVGYDQPDKAATNKTNTSQWDYEGYLGFNSPGNVASGLTLRLDSGVIWNINNDIYNKLKGTVMLYDVDARASSDYE